MTEQGDSLNPDAIISSKTTLGGETERTIHPIDSHGKVKPPLKHSVVSQYDDKANLVERGVLRKNDSSVGQNVDKKA